MSMRPIKMVSGAGARAPRGVCPGPDPCKLRGFGHATRPLLSVFPRRLRTTRSPCTSLLTSRATRWKSRRTTCPASGLTASATAWAACRCPVERKPGRGGGCLLPGSLSSPAPQHPHAALGQPGSAAWVVWVVEPIARGAPTQRRGGSGGSDGVPRVCRPHHCCLQRPTPLRRPLFALPAAGSATSTPATEATSTSLRPETSDTGTSGLPSSPRSSPSAASGTCSGTRRAPSSPPTRPPTERAACPPRARRGPTGPPRPPSRSPAQHFPCTLHMPWMYSTL